VRYLRERQQSHTLEQWALSAPRHSMWLTLLVRLAPRATMINIRYNDGSLFVGMNQTVDGYTNPELTTAARRVVAEVKAMSPVTFAAACLFEPYDAFYRLPY
jgi:hypothetical protein